MIGTRAGAWDDAKHRTLSLHCCIRVERMMMMMLLIEQTGGEAKELGGGSPRERKKRASSRSSRWTDAHPGDNKTIAPFS